MGNQEKMKKVFISRKLSVDSPLLLLFPKMDIINYSLLEFRSLPFELTASDVVFFYSRNAVRFFFSQIKKPYPILIYACMGNGTADELKDFDLMPDFIGAGDNVDIAKDFEKFAKGKQILFPRSKQSLQSIQKLLSGKIIQKDMITYESIPKMNLPHPKADILIFTSPMNAEVYFNEHDYLGEILLAIGKTTATKLRDLGMEGIRIPKEPSEIALATLLMEILNAG